MYFFFSYSRQNNDSFVREWFNDLNSAIKELTGETNDAGFFDQKGLEPGEFWVNELETALRDARVFVAAVTAGYAKSEYCGKEWAAFESRLTNYAKDHNNAIPPLILPIYCHPSEEPLPETITARQYTVGDPKEVYNLKGLKHVYKLKQRFLEEQTNFIDALAKQIITLYKQYADIDQITEVPGLKDLRSAFLPDTAVVSDASTAAAGKGPKRVHFVFGAAKPTEVVQAGKHATDAYGVIGGEEWQPYFPGARKIGSIARQTAATDELNLWSEQMEVTSKLPDEIRKAENQRELVVMFVDSWTAGLPAYRQAMQAFDRQNYTNCSVIVPWNNDDPDTKPNGNKLLAALTTAFQFRVRGQNELYYRAQITSEEELRKHLVDVLIRLRAEVINKSAPDPGAVPESGARPSISNIS